MGLCVSMNVKGKVILLVGGGHVALRKARLFLAEGAIVHVVAPKFHEAFTSMPCHFIYSKYHMQYLKGCFIAVAASNQHKVNAQVIQDANTLGILSMSVEIDEHAHMHALMYHDNGDFQLAVSTKQQAPALNRIMLEDVVQYVEVHYTRRLYLLRELRKRILSNTRIENKHDVLRFLAKADIKILQFLLDAITKKKCLLLCFHGVKPKESIDEISSFIKLLEDNIQNHAVWFTFLSDPILQSVNQKEYKVLPISLIMNLLPKFDIHTILYPMLFQEGRFYDAMLTHAGIYTRVCKPPFHTKDEMRELIQVCLQAYKDYEHMICIYHSSKIGRFASLLEGVKDEFSNVVFIHEAYKNVVDIPFHDEVVTVFPLYMLKGMHMCNETDGTSSLSKRLKEQNCNVLCNTDSCLKQKDIRKLLIEKIIQEM